MQSLQNLFKDNIQGEIEFDQAVLEKYSRDASLFKVLPQVVLFPKDVEDVKNIVKIAARNKVAIAARSAGTDMSGGPLTNSVVVEFTQHFNKIEKIEKESETSGYAITDPGVYYRDFDKATQAKIGMILPSYPASREICTVGGMTANNSGGEKNLQYGKTERYVEEVHIVLRDGNEYLIKSLTLDELEQKKKSTTVESEIYTKMHELIIKNYDLIMSAKPHVSKNSAGYYLWNVYDKDKKTFDLVKLIVGSQGTLGLITKIKYKLVKPHTHSRMLVIFLNDMKNLGEITNHILFFKPESLESYDDHTFKLATKLFPQMLARMGGNLFTLGLRFFPEFWAIITGGVPKLVILAEFTADSDDVAHARALEAQKSLQEFGLKSKVTNSTQDVEKYWVIRRESFNMLRHHVKNLRTAPFIDDFVVPTEVLPEFLPKLYTLLDQYKITYTVAGHVGDGIFHIIPLMDLKKAESITAINELMEKVNSLVISYKGSITGEHNDGIVRTPYLEKMYGRAIYSLFEETKNIFDPDHIFNPGKKVGGTWNYAMKHLDINMK